MEPKLGFYDLEDRLGAGEIEETSGIKLVIQINLRWLVAFILLNFNEIIHIVVHFPLQKGPQIRNNKLT